MLIDQFQLINRDIFGNATLGNKVAVYEVAPRQYKFDIEKQNGEKKDFMFYLGHALSDTKFKYTDASFNQDESEAITIFNRRNRHL